MGFNKRTMKVGNWCGRKGIMGADITIIGLDMPIYMINFYSPCHNRDEFWDNWMAPTIMKGEHIIMGGDLNFSIGLVESWGLNVVPNPLSVYFEHLIDDADMLDLAMPTTFPTW